MVDFFIKKKEDRIEYFIFTSTNLSIYTTTEARESHCNFRGTKQETLKLHQAAHLPPCLGFIPGASTGVGHSTCGEREGERGEERSSTHGAHRNKNGNMKKTSGCVPQGSVIILIW